MLYDRVWDDSDDLFAINDLAQRGWRVISAIPDAARGTMFILEHDDDDVGVAPRAIGRAVDPYDKETVH